MRSALSPHGFVLNRLTAGRIPAWPVAAGSLILGFAIAQATGVRALGGVVLVAGAAWCAARWRAEAGTGRAAVLLGLYAAGFVTAHLIADALGSWGAVLAVAAVVALASIALADRRPLSGAAA